MAKSREPKAAGPGDLVSLAGALLGVALVLVAWLGYGTVEAMVGLSGAIGVTALVVLARRSLLVVAGPVTGAIVGGLAFAGGAAVLYEKGLTDTFVFRGEVYAGHLMASIGYGAAIFLSGKIIQELLCYWLRGHWIAVAQDEVRDSARFLMALTEQSSIGFRRRIYAFLFLGLAAVVVAKWLEGSW